MGHILSKHIGNVKRKLQRLVDRAQDLLKLSLSDEEFDAQIAYWNAAMTVEGHLCYVYHCYGEMSIDHSLTFSTATHLKRLRDKRRSQKRSLAIIRERFKREFGILEACLEWSETSEALLMNDPSDGEGASALARINNPIAIQWQNRRILKKAEALRSTIKFVMKNKYTDNEDDKADATAVDIAKTLMVRLETACREHYVCQKAELKMREQSKSRKDSVVQVTVGDTHC